MANDRIQESLEELQRGGMTPEIAYHEDRRRSLRDGESEDDRRRRLTDDERRRRDESKLPRESDVERRDREQREDRHR